MPKPISIRTSRLLMRQWKQSDLKPFAELNADLDVMKYFPNVLTEAESRQIAHKLEQFINENGYGFWAVELLPTGKSTGGEFIGFVGLNQIKTNSDLARELYMTNAPFLEIGWRLAKQYWHNGYATESAKEVLQFAFNQLKINTVYSFTALKNLPSQKVMQRIGMTNTGIEFNHPILKDGHELQRHCLYQITAS